MKIYRILALIAIAAMLSTVGASAIAASPATSAGKFDRLRGIIKPVKAQKEYRVAFAGVHFVDSYWTGVAYGILDEAKRSGVDVVRILSAGGYGHLRDQIAQLNSLSSLDLDALVIGASTFNGLQRPLQKLADKGVTIVAMDLSVKSSDVYLRVGQSQFEIGRKMGEYICNQNPNATVISIPGPAGVEWTAERLNGVKDAFAGCPNITLVGNVFKGNTTLEDGLSQAADLLVKYPEANYIYAAAVSLGTGAARAISRAHSSAKVVTGGFTANTAELMKDGIITMVVSEPGVLLGRLSLQYVLRILDGDSLPNLSSYGNFPYPSFNMSPKAVTLEDLEDYDLHWYDFPPEGWKVPL